MKSQKGHRYSNLNSNTKSASSTNTHTTKNFRYRNVLGRDGEQTSRTGYRGNIAAESVELHV